MLSRGCWTLPGDVMDMVSSLPAAHAAAPKLMGCPRRAEVYAICDSKVCLRDKGCVMLGDEGDEGC